MPKFDSSTWLSLKYCYELIPKDIIESTDPKVCLPLMLNSFSKFDLTG